MGRRPFPDARAALRALAALAALAVAALPVPLAAAAPAPAGRPNTSIPRIEPAHWVDPFVGTGGHGHTYPGATVPFGMVQLSPDTRLEGWDGCSGYHFSDSVIYGFSHTHLSGTGVGDYCDVLLVPITGPARLRNGAGEPPGAGYASRFSKQTERAEPGYYAVHLDDAGVDVELSATARTGLHRYRFPAGQPAHVVIDLTHRDPLLGSWLRAQGPSEIEGMRRSASWARDQVVYFVARFSRPFELSAEDSARAALSFGDQGGELVIAVGISSVDVEGARRNLEREARGLDFDAVRRRARQRWNQALAAIDVEGGTPAQRTVFATALYHSLLAPNIYSDVDGRYRGRDKAIHRAQGRDQYTVFSLWDTFRATHPLLTLLEPKRTSEFVATFLAQYQQGGRLPVWELAANETDCMIGYHSASVIADAWQKGLRNYDGRAVLAAMAHGAALPDRGLDDFQRQGFVAAERESESVSKTLEYAYDDWCIARMAEQLGHGELAARFYERSQGWRHLLDPRTGFFRPRRNGQWVQPFDPRRVDIHYTEANAWQYGFFVPHDLEGLIKALGGEAAFVARLDSLFTAPSATLGRDQADITGLIGQYAHGNEPSHHVAWLYHYAGQPSKGMARVRQILDTLYADGPDGLSGNEDCGQMSSWYVFGALGLYPVCPGSGEYVLGAPLFPQTKLRLKDAGGRSHTLSIEAEGAGPSGIYVQAARWNGRPLTRSFLTHRELTRGGRLQLVLGPHPTPQWGSAPADRPRSRVEAPRVLASPWIEADGDSFRDSVTVTFHCADAGARVRWTDDPVSRSEAWQTADGPLVLHESTTLAFCAETDQARSPTVTARFHRIPHAWDIVTAHPPRPPYDPGSPLTLIDGIEGGSDFRTGAWSGYLLAPFVATVDLGQARAVRRAGGRFLQDVQSWIWMPSQVIVSVSDDGNVFREVGRAGPDIALDAYGAQVAEIVAELPGGGVTARWVRIEAPNIGPIPAWHPGRGEPSWVFVDELRIE